LARAVFVEWHMGQASETFDRHHEDVLDALCAGASLQDAAHQGRLLKTYVDALAGAQTPRS
jgi:hypothetical protein